MLRHVSKNILAKLLVIRITSAGALQIMNGDTTLYTSPNGRIAANKTYYTALIVPSKNVQIYLNKSKLVTIPVTNVVNNIPQYLVAGGFGFNGYIDEVVYSRSALPASQVTTHAYTWLTPFQ